MFHFPSPLLKRGNKIAKLLRFPGVTCHAPFAAAARRTSRSPRLQWHRERRAVLPAPRMWLAVSPWVHVIIFGRDSAYATSLLSVRPFLLSIPRPVQPRPGCDMLLLQYWTNSRASPAFFFSSVSSLLSRFAFFLLGRGHTPSCAFAA